MFKALKQAIHQASAPQPIYEFHARIKGDVVIINERREPIYTSAPDALKRHPMEVFYNSKDPSECIVGATDKASALKAIEISQRKRHRK